jgi:hypothetical protein
MMVFLGVAGIHSAIALSHDGMCRQHSHNLALIAFFFSFFSSQFSLLINFLACQKIKIKNYCCHPGSM